MATSRFVAARLALSSWFFPVLLATACAPPGEPLGPAPVSDPDVVGVSLSLTAVQPDARCIRLTFTGSMSTITQTAAPAAGSTAPLVFTGLPARAFTLLVEAFNLACASVVPTTPLSWTSEPMTVVLAPGALTPVTVSLRRPAGTAVSVDFDTSLLFQAPPPGVSNLRQLAVLGDSLYVARSELERMPITGGNPDSTLPVLAYSFVVDASGIYYYTGQSPAGSFWIPPGRQQVLLHSRSPVSMAAIPGGYVESGLADSTMLNSGTIHRVTSAGVSTPLVTGFSSLNLPFLATDGTTVFYAIFTRGSGAGIGDQTIVGKVPVAGGAASTLATFARPSYYASIATDGAFAYVSVSSSTPTLNGIFRVPAAGGAPTPVALVPAGVPATLLVDATNVYYVVRAEDNRGSCDVGSILRAPKAGGTPTTLWSRSKVCPTYLAQSTTWLFFDQGDDVHRLDK